MLSSHRVALVASVMLAVGCRDVTAPPTSQLAYISAIEMPEQASIADTVRIGFSYGVSCGEYSVRILQASSRVEISVHSVTSPDLLCRAWYYEVRAQVVLMPSQRVGDVTVVFRQPLGVDSVRTIAQTVDAP